jgi:predicted extracellular nuclease
MTFGQAKRIIVILGAVVVSAAAPAARAQPAFVPICAIQGGGSNTPYEGETVQTSGVVVLDLDTTSFKGFYIQQENCDGNPSTSDGIFVFTGLNTNLVSLGDVISVEGGATEFYGLTQISTTPGDVTKTGVSALPNPVPFSPPWDNSASQAAFEAHEGMRISMPDVTVVGPTNALAESFVVDTALGVGRVFQGGNTGVIVAVDDDGIFEILPVVKVGDRVTGLVGVLDYSIGMFRFQLTSQPAVIPAAQPAPETAWFAFDFASLNAHNLFDTIDDPLTQDTVLTAAQYQTKLEKLARAISGDLGEPHFIAIQEAENGAVLQALANRPEISIQYLYAWIDGPDLRGIDVALLYDMERVEHLSTTAEQGCTDLIDGLGPDGNQNVYNPQNALTCDLDGLPGFEGNRLFSRPPLVVNLRVCENKCAQPGAKRELWVIAVHLKSKTEDTATVQYTLPRRLEEAQFLVELTGSLQSAHPGAEIILLGDFNDYPNSQPLAIMDAAGLVNLTAGLPAADRYTYIYQGVSQILDYTFASPSLFADPASWLFHQSIHISADYPASLEDDANTSLRASDHDPLLSHLAPNPFTLKIYLPLIARAP